MFTRFSTVAGNKGSADLARDVRGFAVKFYTQQGNLPAISVPKLARQYNVKANQIFNWRRKMTDGSVLVASAEAATAAPFAQSMSPWRLSREWWGLGRSNRERAPCA